MTSSNPPCREGPNQFRPSLTRAPGRRDRRGGEFVGGYVGRLPRHTRSLPNGKPVASSPNSSVSLRIRSSRRQRKLLDINSGFKGLQDHQSFSGLIFLATKWSKTGGP